MRDVVEVATDAMAEAHDARAWDKVVAVGDAWLEARGGLPAMPAVWYAQALMGLGRFGEAVPWAKTAAEHMPSTTLAEQIAQFAANSTYAQGLARIGQLSKARRVLREMLNHRVQHPETLEKLGHIQLTITDKWRDGWALHEQREHAQTLPDGLVKWDGVTQGTIGVLHEQGIGDAVLMARWLPMLAKRSGHPVVWFGPEQVLGRWIADLPNVIVGKRGADMTPVDFAAWSMSLPHILGCAKKSDIPPAVAPAALVEHRADILRLRADRTGPSRIGVCWKGSSTGWHDFERSFTPEQFAPVWAPLDGVEFVNLAQDTPIPPDSPFGPTHFEDVYDAGWVISDLDLVVTVDTAVAHIAGSLHVPTLVLVPTVPDWRYAWPSSQGSPFYSSVTVCRRLHGADLSVLGAARAMVEQFAGALKERA